MRMRVKVLRVSKVRPSAPSQDSSSAEASSYLRYVSRTSLDLAGFLCISLLPKKICPKGRMFLTQLTCFESVVWFFFFTPKVESQNPYPPV